MKSVLWVLRYVNMFSKFNILPGRKLEFLKIATPVFFSFLFSFFFFFQIDLHGKVSYRFHWFLPQISQ